MDTREQTLSLFIEDVIPTHIKSSHPMFVSFIKAYYDWAEQTGNFQNISHVVGNIDNPEFIEEYYNLYSREYAQLYPLDMPVNKEIFIKTISVLLRGKSTIASIQAFFKILFNDLATVEFPPRRNLTPTRRSTILVRGFEEQVTAGRYREYFSMAGDFIESEEGVILFVENVEVLIQNGSDQVITELSDDDVIEGRLIYTFFCSNQKNGRIFEPTTVVRRGSPDSSENEDGSVGSPIPLFRVLSGFVVNDGGDGYKVGDIIRVTDGTEVLSGTVVVSEIEKFGNADASTGPIKTIVITDPGVGFNSDSIETVSVTGAGRSNTGIAFEIIRPFKDDDVRSRANEPLLTSREINRGNGLENKPIDDHDEEEIEPRRNEPIEGFVEGTEENREEFSISFPTSGQFDVRDSTNEEEVDNEDSYKYIISSSVPVRVWEKLLIDIVHPAGVEFEAQIKSISSATSSTGGRIGIRGTVLFVSGFDDVPKFVSPSASASNRRILEQRSLFEFTDPYEIGEFEESDIAKEENDQISEYEFKGE